MKKICVITGTRAEYGLLKPLISKIKNDNQLELKLIVTGMHLSPEFGLTYKEIEHDDFIIDEKIEILMSSDSSIGINKAMGLAMISFSECYQRLQPDIILVLGDRYEIFSAVSAATVARIPVAHLHGGETTEGAIDEAMRHSITKMSYLHFTSTSTYKNRIIQLGEDPSRVFNVGAIGIENIKNINPLPKDVLERDINFRFGQYTALVTFHPVTLENNYSSEDQFKILLNALDQIEGLKVIFTKANSDMDGRIINTMIDEYVNINRDKYISFTSMGQLRYLSAMKYVDVVIGNSSSGIIEAPSFNVPTVNIGDRQRGRIQAKSILNCPAEKEEIVKAINNALKQEFRKSIRTLENPYGNGNVSNKVIDEIKLALSKQIDIKKKFYDIKGR
ncbi:UDP-N-acetylglucosamine 2-epimerase [Ornithinibacillus salinisoli]|uniref:UDP-N-acetylglucosamine 2-epimerase n=1 Tax=Ornithinibacillus salinisoli TaxID=1848459 RepID=A0ABW4VZ99_9BACI